MNKAVISIHQAKSNLSKLVKRAAAGEQILIGGYGRAEAVLSSIDSLSERKLGLMKGEFTVPDDFDDPLPQDVLQAMAIE
ncbi:MAG: type II toxin-antitoxin system prevent-host-death family antitoxin [Desulfovibrio sp.]|nr:type II toxin-antitoxin system prevent-host-death family antitoxin [Desulfovibrio sp.]